jgi:putative membrane protein
MLLGLTFASLNPNPVKLDYYFGSRQIALSLALVLSFGAGIFLGLFVSMFSLLKAKRDNRSTKSRLKIVEKEVENLRSLPIKGD